MYSACRLNVNAWAAYADVEEYYLKEIAVYT